ncbi:MAG: hypothetical protein KC493_13985 [Bacteriovoracaceae bacterium]|nr:hypothetical protein [Bacteriovoracaceae bacterium]
MAKKIIILALLLAGEIFANSRVISYRNNSNHALAEMSIDGGKTHITMGKQSMTLETSKCLEKVFDNEMAYIIRQSSRDCPWAKRKGKIRIVSKLEKNIILCSEWNNSNHFLDRIRKCNSK